MKPVEIVVGDDGSEDGTVELIRKWAAHSAIHVRISVNPNRLGFAENFLQAASRARGRVIAFADQDDVWLPGRLAAATAALSSSETTLWVSGWRMVAEDLSPLPDRRVHTGFLERTTIANPLGVISGSRLVFRSELLDNLPPDGRPISMDGAEPASHDEWICFAARVLGRIALSRAPLMLYRRHPGASTIANPAVASRTFLLGREGEGSLLERRRAALERAGYLEARVAITRDDNLREKMLTAAALYRTLAPRLGRRVSIYATPLRRRRVGALTTNALRGDYRSVRRGGLGSWALAQDLFTFGRSTPRLR